MSTFRVVYRQDRDAQRPPDEVDAVEFIRRDPWIIFLDPAGPCFTTRTERVQRIEQLVPGSPRVEPTPSPPSDLPLPAMSGRYHP
jgi:hypothetical protein